MEVLVQCRNMATALKGVKAKRGSAGAYGMTVDEIVPYLKARWARISETMLEVK